MEALPYTVDVGQIHKQHFTAWVVLYGKRAKKEYYETNNNQYEKVWITNTSHNLYKLSLLSSINYLFLCSIFILISTDNKYGNQEYIISFKVSKILKTGQ